MLPMATRPGCGVLRSPIACVVGCSLGGTLNFGVPTNWNEDQRATTWDHTTYPCSDQSVEDVILSTRLQCWSRISLPGNGGRPPQRSTKDCDMTLEEKQGVEMADFCAADASASKLTHSTGCLRVR